MVNVRFCYIARGSLTEVQSQLGNNSITAWPISSARNKEKGN